MKLSSAFAFLLTLLQLSFAEEANLVDDTLVKGRPIIRLWPIDQVGGEQNRLKYDITNRGKIRYENVKDPHLVVFHADSKQPSPAVIYCPGGGYHHLTPEQTDIEELNKMGLSVFMLRYTVPKNRKAAFKDVQRAMRLVRHQAKELNVIPDQIGVFGTSAGGHLVARLSQHYATPAYPAIDKADQKSCEPQFVILTSAAYFSKGKSEKLKSIVADEFPMTAKIAPTFLVYAKDDRNYIAGGIAYEKKLKALGGSTRIVISETGGHGLKDVHWYPACREWLEELAVIKPTDTPQK